MSAGLRAVGTGTNQIPDISYFLGSLAVNGWVKIPLMNGKFLIIQAGAVQNRDDTSLQFRLNFPISFTNRCAALVLTSWNADTGHHFGHAFRDVAGAQIKRSTVAHEWGFDWIAVGE